MASQGSKHLVILGCGFMGTAILQGLLEKPDDDQDWQYTACVRKDSSIERLQQMKDDVGAGDRLTVVSGARAVSDAAKKADIVMLGCAPGDINTLLSSPGLVESVRLQKTLIVSLLAGVSTQQLGKKFEKSTRGERGPEEPADNHVSADTSKGGEKAQTDEAKTEGATLDIARVIPSIGAKIGDSVTLLAKSDSLSAKGESDVNRLFQRVGAVLPVQESLMDDATAIGAACHALNFLAVDAITDASVAEGMDRSTAMLLAAQSLRSSSNLFCAGGMTPEQLKTAMSTPKGITINSAVRLQANNVPAGIADAVRVAVQYARSM